MIAYQSRTFREGVNAKVRAMYVVGLCVCRSVSQGLLKQHWKGNDRAHTRRMDVRLQRSFLSEDRHGLLQAGRRRAAARSPRWFMARLERRALQSSRLFPTYDRRLDWPAPLATFSAAYPTLRPRFIGVHSPIAPVDQPGT